MTLKTYAITVMAWNTWQVEVDANSPEGALAKAQSTYDAFGFAGFYLKEAGINGFEIIDEREVSI